MNALTPFSFEGAQVRTITVDGEAWFVGKDVAETLGYANPADAIARHCKGVAKRYPLQTAGGTQEVRVLAESDVLRLIVSSSLPAAERFERWVFEEVLPTIRRTGSYGVPTAFAIPQTLSEALRLAADQADTIEKQTQALALAAPKVEVFDRLVQAEGSMSITDAAKKLKINPIQYLFDWMVDNRWIFKRPGGDHYIAFQDKLRDGLLEERMSQPKTMADGTLRTFPRLLVTPAGLAKLSELVPRPGVVVKARRRRAKRTEGAV